VQRLTANQYWFSQTGSKVYQGVVGYRPQDFVIQGSSHAHWWQKHL